MWRSRSWPPRLLSEAVAGTVGIVTVVAVVASIFCRVFVLADMDFLLAEKFTFVSIRTHARTSPRHRGTSPGGPMPCRMTLGELGSR